MNWHGRVSRSALMVLVMPLVVCTQGCSTPQPLPQGRGAIVAKYSMPTLRTTLPDAARVPGVMAAADMTLRSRGYAIDSITSTEEAGRIVARAPSPQNPQAAWPRVVVSAKRVWNGTTLSIEVLPLGDQGTSRVLLDGILQKLDL